MTLPRDEDPARGELGADQLSSPDLAADDGAETTDGEPSTAAIRDDIEDTRTEMGETLGELGDRLDPQRVMKQAKENVREATIGRAERVVEEAGETARGTSEMVINTIKENPIPAAIAGAGLFMLWRNRSQTGDAHQRMRGPYGAYDRRYYDGGWADQRYYDERLGERGPGGALRGDSIGGATGNVAGAVGDTAGNVAGTVGDLAGTAVGSVGDAASTVAEGAGQLAGGAVEQGRHTAMEIGSQLDRFMRASPLAMGAIAYGVGAVVGALVPETRQEHEILAKPAEQVGNSVRDTVNQAMDKVEERADKAERELSRA